MYKPKAGDIHLWCIYGWFGNGVLLDSYCDIFLETGVTRSTAGVSLIAKPDAKLITGLQDVYVKKDYFGSRVAFEAAWRKKVSLMNVPLEIGKTYDIYSIYGYKVCIPLCENIVVSPYPEYTVIDNWGNLSKLRIDNNVLGVCPHSGNTAVDILFGQCFTEFKATSMYNFSLWRKDFAERLYKCHVDNETGYQFIPLNPRLTATQEQINACYPVGKS